MRTNDSIIKSIWDKVTDVELNQLYMYYEILNEESKKINLTSITEIEEVYIKHFYDSILLAKSIDIYNKHIVDVGTGAGFPGIVLKIVFPNLKITLIDALQKRINYLNEIIVDELFIIYVNDEILFDELNSIIFPYNNKWYNFTLGDENGDFLIYLKKGTNTLKMEVSLGAYSTLIERIQKSIEESLSCLFTSLVFKHTYISSRP